MASPVAATLVAVACSNLHRFSKPFVSYPPFRTLPLLTCSLSSSSSSSSSSLEFNISFAPPKPKPRPESTPAETNPFPESDDAPSGQLFIPWIVRGEDGNLKLQAHPPESVLKVMASVETSTNTSTNTKKKKQKAEKGKQEPKYSKAARRFYNENFKDSGMRLSKVLAAAGGNFIT